MPISERTGSATPPSASRSQHYTGTRYAKFNLAVADTLLRSVPNHAAESKDCAEKGGLVLTLKVEGVRSSKGQIRAELLGKQAGDAKAKTVTFGVKDAQTGSVLIEFPGLAPGDYAVQLYHDENANGKVDMNMVGIPLEGFGFSNTPMVTGGIPEFDKMKVSLSADSTTTAVLAYAP